MATATTPSAAWCPLPTPPPGGAAQSNEDEREDEPQVSMSLPGFCLLYTLPYISSLALIYTHSGPPSRIFPSRTPVIWFYPTHQPPPQIKNSMKTNEHNPKGDKANQAGHEERRRPAVCPVAARYCPAPGPLPPAPTNSAGWSLRRSQSISRSVCQSASHGHATHATHPARLAS